MRSSSTWSVSRSARWPTVTVALGDVDADHVARLGAAGETEAVALADGDQLDGADVADRLAGLIDDGARVGLEPRPEERGAAAGGGDEAHVLAVGLVGGGQPQASRVGAHLVLRQVADREEGAREGRLVEHVHDVGLVLGRDRLPAPRAGTRRRASRCGRGGRWPPRRSRAHRPAERAGRTSRAGCTRCTGSGCGPPRGRPRRAPPRARRSRRRRRRCGARCRVGGPPIERRRRRPPSSSPSRTRRPTA